MEVFGTPLTLLALFVSFGFMVGVLFGFFGMGGSFLVTPALLVMGYPARVAVGSGMAFVFGTAGSPARLRRCARNRVVPQPRR